MSRKGKRPKRLLDRCGVCESKIKFIDRVPHNMSGTLHKCLSGYKLNIARERF